MVKMAEIPDLLQQMGLNPPVAVLSDGNQISIPKSVADAFEDKAYFEIAQEGERIVLTLIQLPPPGAVSEKLAALGITEDDVADAVAWARRGDGDSP